MTLSDGMENGLGELIFQNDATGTTIAAIGDGLRNAVTPGSFYVSLHTADPTDSGNQTSSEVSYTGYARVAVARSSGGWTVAAENVSNAAKITFGQRTDTGTATATHVGIGTAVSGAGNLICSGALSPSVAITLNTTPEFEIGDLDINWS